MTAIDRLRHANTAAIEEHVPTPARPKSRWTKRAAIIGGIGVLTTGVGVAQAAWLASNSGTGAATAHATFTLTVAGNSTPSPTNQLYPGTNGDLELAITAPTQYGITVTGFGQGTGGAASITSGAGSNCIGGRTGTHPTGLAYNLSATQQTLSSSFTVAAGATGYVVLTNAIAMDNTSDASCAGTTFSVPVQVNATSLPSATTSVSATAASPTAIS